MRWGAVAAILLVPPTPFPMVDYMKSRPHVMSSRNYVCPGLLALFVSATIFSQTQAADRPNVIVIMSDDQGVGDYGFMGNEVIKTPNLDQMRQRGMLLTNFHVSPVCAPTRASLMTGRYNYRTRCIDTYVGRAMMDPAEITIAEYLSDAGYQTGIFGKWHLGDNYPMRPMDQGFDESLVHLGGGIGQPSDPIGAEGKYTDPTLFRNGEKTQLDGYCTDIYFDSAMDFAKKASHDGKPFFAYLATNAPHGPFHDVPDDLYQQYKQAEFDPILLRHPPKNRRAADLDKLARIAAMITNIDQNVGRLFEYLEGLGIADNTIVMYLNDNGPNTARYVGNMRGRKTQVDDGGIRSPLLIHWPSKIQPGSASDIFTAHIDVVPTLLEACQAESNADVKIDGLSFFDAITSETTDWPRRQIVFQSHRGNEPQKFHNFAIHEEPWKLVHPSGFGQQNFSGDLKLELYNLADDPQQSDNVADQNPAIVHRLKSAYADWFSDVSSTRPDNYAPPRIVIGTDNEPTTILTRQDWRHESGNPWGRESNGKWLVHAPEDSRFQVEVILPDAKHSVGKAIISVGENKETISISGNQQRGHFANISVSAGNWAIKVDLVFDGEKRGPHQVIFARR